MKKKLSWLKTRRLRKLGYFKLPKFGHPWVGSAYTWARILEDRRVMPYSEEYLATCSILQITENSLYFSTRFGDDILSDDSKTTRKLPK